MEFKDAQRYLDEVRDMRLLIKKKDEKIAEIRMRMESIGSNVSDERIQTSPRHDALEMRVIKSIEECKKLELETLEMLSTYWKMQEVAYNRIMKLKDGKRREFLLLYYIDCKSYTEISYMFNHDEESSIYHLRDLAIKYFCDVAEKRKWKL